MRKIIASIVITAVVVGGGAFYGGMLYGKQSGARPSQRGGMQFSGAMPQGGGAGGRGARFGGGTGLVAGEVLSKSETSVTVKLRDGGSRIVLLSPSTKVTTSALGALTDVKEGAQVVVNGSQNSDGSLTAESIQLR